MTRVESQRDSWDRGVAVPDNVPSMCLAMPLVAALFRFC